MVKFFFAWQTWNKHMDIFLHSKPHGYFFLRGKLETKRMFFFGVANLEPNTWIIFWHGKLGTKHMDCFLRGKLGTKHMDSFPDFQFRHVHECNAEGSD